MLAESTNCGPGSGVVGLVDEPPPKDDKKLLGKINFYITEFLSIIDRR